MSVAEIGRGDASETGSPNPSHQTPISSSCHIITTVWPPSRIVAGYLVTKSNDGGGEEGKKKRLVYSALCSTRAPPGVEVEGGRKEVSVTCYRSRRLSLYDSDKALTFPRTSLRVEL